MVQGVAGLAQPGSIGDGTRLPWLKLANAVMFGCASHVTPAAGLNWL